MRDETPKAPVFPRQVMPRINGKPFRCDCGCNVFTERDTLRFECNSCGEMYVGEKATSP